MSAICGCKIHGDRWEGVMNHEWRIEQPSQQDMEQALQRLDAETYTMMTIHGEGERHMTIGGGGGQYVVYATFDNEEFWNLLSPQDEQGVVLLNAGGQEGDYPSGQIVNLEEACAAARTFFCQQRLDPDLRWTKQ
jgi:hypothetical protein